MDEWHSVGELPVVVYGKRGELIRVHSTDSLGLRDDVLHVKTTTSSYWWNEDSMSFFGPDEETFFIRLHWGRLLLLRLDDGDLMNEEWYKMCKGWLMPEEKWRALHRYAGQQLRERAFQWLNSRNPEEQKIGATICGQEKFKKAISQLKELLKDKEYSRTLSIPKGWTRIYYVRKAAKEALRNLGEECGDVVIEEQETPEAWKQVPDWIVPAAETEAEC